MYARWHLPYRPATSPRALGGTRLPPALRFGPATGPAAGGRGPLAREPALALIEAALVIAEEPLPTRKLADVAGLKDAAEARRLVRRLQALYDQDGAPFQVAEVAGGFQLLTRAELHPWLAPFRPIGPEGKLSPAARETLAIIAYRQPIMRADLEGIRGVQCGDVLRQLMDRGLIRIAGRHSSLGRPVLYGTTKKFLQIYGLKGLEELPRADEWRKPMGEGEGKAAPD